MGEAYLEGLQLFYDHPEELSLQLSDLDISAQSFDKMEGLRRPGGRREQLLHHAKPCDVLNGLKHARDQE